MAKRFKNGTLLNISTIGTVSPKMQSLHCLAMHHGTTRLHCWPWLQN
jgi:hypothetical protein